MISSGSALRRSRPFLSRLTSAICAGTATVALTLAPSCSSRSGGGAPASPAPAAAQAAPEILRFAEDKTSILAGQTLHLTADFANGSAVIEPGDLAVTSGVPVTLTPDVTTTYTLTVTDSGGNKTVETASVTVAPLVSGMALLAGEINGRGNVDGVGALARFRNPGGVAVDGSGNVFVADSGNSTIRKITPDGAVSTLAGTADQTGDVDAKGADARFNYPNAMTMDANGNLYVTDSNNNHAIRKITPDGVVTHVTAHEPGSQVPFPFGFLNSLVVDGSGTLFVTDYVNNTIDRIGADGTVTTLAGLAGESGAQDGTGGSARFYFPQGIALGADGNLYVADSWNNTIRMVTPYGVVSTLAGNPEVPGVDDGNVASATFDQPAGIAVIPSGTIFVTSASGIRKISDGVVSTLAGNAASAATTDGPSTAEIFNQLKTLALDSEGNLYGADSYDGVICKITPEADVSTLAGKAEKYSAAFDGAGESANFNTPAGMATDGAGNTYVADFNGNAIRKVSSAGEVTTLAGRLGSQGFQNGQGDQALFAGPSGVAVDGKGNLYVLDSYNNVVRMITPQGMVSTLAGDPRQPGNLDGTGAGALFSFNSQASLAVDGNGNIFVTQPFAVRMIDPKGVVTTLAGDNFNPGDANGTGSDARFAFLSGIAVDGAGMVYVADSINYLIRKITPAGVVTTLAGTGASGNQDGSASAASFGHLTNLTLDSKGNYLYAADYSNNSIRKVSTSDGSVTTVVGIPGVQGTVPGPLPASLNTPQGVAWDPTGPGHLLISVPDAILRVTF